MLWIYNFSLRLRSKISFWNSLLKHNLHRINCRNLMCNLVSFDINLFLWNQSQLMNPSIPQRSSLLFVVSFFHTNLHLPFQDNHLCAFHHHRYICFSKFYKNGTIQYVFFFGLLVSLTKIILRSIHIIACISIVQPFKWQEGTPCMAVPWLVRFRVRVRVQVRLLTPVQNAEKALGKIQHFLMMKMNKEWKGTFSTW